MTRGAVDTNTGINCVFFCMFTFVHTVLQLYTSETLDSGFITGSNWVCGGLDIEGAAHRDSPDPVFTSPLTWLNASSRAAVLYDGQLGSWRLCSSCCSAASGATCWLFFLEARQLSWSAPRAYRKNRDVTVTSQLLDLKMQRIFSSNVCMQTCLAQVGGVCNDLLRRPQQLLCDWLEWRGAGCQEALQGAQRRPPHFPDR